MRTSRDPRSRATNPRDICLYFLTIAGPFISDACDAMPSIETCRNALKRHFRVDHSCRVQVVCLGMNVVVDKRGEPTLSRKTDYICPTKTSRLPVTETANAKPPKTSIHSFISGVTKSQHKRNDKASYEQYLESARISSSNASKSSCLMPIF